MNCMEARESLPLRAAGERGDDESLDAHLALCGACARRAELEAAAWHFAGLVPDEPVPAAVLERFGERMAPRPRRLLLNLLQLGTIAAAAVLVVAVLRTPASRPAIEEAQLMEGGPASAYLEPAFGTLETVGEGESGPLRLRSHTVSVEISDWMVRTEVEEVFFNDSDRRLEGTFVFPLPPGAAISRFAMEVNGALVEGELVERVRAREVYEGIVRRMEDPALLEWMPGNLFKARVFPIEPRSPKRIILAYTQAPRISSGALTYVYPLVSEKTKAHPPGELVIQAELRSERPIRMLSSPTHRADVTRRDARSGRVRLEVRDARPAQDFHVRAEFETEEIAVEAHRPAPDEDGYIGIAFAPRGDAGRAPPGTRVFVLDRSARMGAKDLAVSRRVVDRMIDGLGPLDRVGFVAHHVEAESREPRIAAEGLRREWREWMHGLRGEGASDVLAALRAAAALAGEGGTVVYVGKGVPTWGEAEPWKAAAGALEGRTFRAVAVGSGADEAGLGRVAGLRGGAVQRVIPGGDTEEQIEAVARTASASPVLDVEVSVEGVEVSGLLPARIAGVFPGERVHLFGRYAGAGRATVTVRGLSAGGRFERRHDVDLPAVAPGHASLARLWAEASLAGRTAECRRAGEPRGLVDGIVAMSRKYQVMTPYTSFLVLEGEEAYKQHRIERAKRLAEETVKAADPAAAPREAGREVERRLRAGERLLEARRFEDAARAFEAAGARDLQAQARMARRVEAQQAQSDYDAVVRKLGPTPETAEPQRAREEQARIYVSQRHYETALVLHDKNDFDKAKVEVQKAVESWHENLAARKLLLDLNRLTVIGRPEYGARSMGEDGGRGFQVRIEQAQIEITKHVRDGERYYAAGMYDEARKEFDSAAVRILRIPGEDRAMADLLPRVEEYAVKTRNAQSLRRVPAGGGEDPRRALDALHELELLKGQALMHFERQEYGQAAEAAERLLSIAPNLTSALEMKNVAQRLGHMKAGRDDLRGQVEEWRRGLARGEAAGPADPGVLEFADLEAWRGIIAKRKPKGISELEEDVQPEDQEILDKLKSIRITIDMKDAPLTAVIEYVREISGLNIHIDTKAIENPEQLMISFKVADVLLDGALRLMLGRQQKAYKVEGGVVVITSEEALKKQVKLELYDVQDLTYGMLDFPGKDSSLTADGVTPNLRPRGEGDGRPVAAKELLATLRVDWAARATPLEALQYLADRSGLAFRIDDGALATLRRAGAAEREFRGTVLGEALKKILEPQGFEHEVAGNGVLIVRFPARSGEDLATRIRAAVAPESWVEAEGKSIQFQNGLLIVRNSAAVHQAIGRFLAGLRGR